MTNIPTLVTWVSILRRLKIYHNINLTSRLRQSDLPLDITSCPVTSWRFVLCAVKKPDGWDRRAWEWYETEHQGLVECVIGVTNKSLRLSRSVFTKKCENGKWTTTIFSVLLKKNIQLLNLAVRLTGVVWRVRHK